MFTRSETIATYSIGNLLLWITLAFQAGILNVGGFLSCGRFVSHLTGFAGYFGLEAAQQKWPEAWGMLTVPFFFLMGSIISAVLIDLRMKKHQRPLYPVTFALCAAIVLLTAMSGHAGFFGEFGKPHELRHDFSLLALLCLVCGIQNAMVTSVSKSIVRTTHLTGITTDLGIGIIRWLHYKKHSSTYSEEGKANVMRMGIIVFFGIGSIVGAYGFFQWGFMGFILPGLIYLALFSHSLTNTVLSK